MAKRMRKSEREYINARNALMRSIQRTNKAFGSSMKLSDIVDVPTPAQAKKMSYKELKAATRKIQKARKNDKGEKVTYVPTGTGNVAKVPTKDYNAAMSELGKTNAALRQRLSPLSKARPAEKKRREGTRAGRRQRTLDGAKPASAFDVQASRGQSKVTPTREFTPSEVFTGGKARGNVDEIVKRFKNRGRHVASKPRKWKESDAQMRKNFEKMFEATGQTDILDKLRSLTDEQLLWAVYEENFGAMIDLVGFNYRNATDAPPGDLADELIDQMDYRALEIIEQILDDAGMMEFE